MINKRILIILVLLVLILSGLVIWQLQKYLVKIGGVPILTDKIEYAKGEILRVSVQNNLNKTICFSSCYSYLLEKKLGVWESYQYAACQKADTNQNCINPGDKKAFEFNLSSVAEGLHRIAIPVCFNCKEGEEFKENKRFYSNEFKVK